MTRNRKSAAWRQQRPFVGALLLVIAGVEMFFSTQLDIGNLHVQLGIEGFQATIIPIGFVLLGVLIALMPQHRIFYGVLALALSVYSIIGVNLGGFIVGFLLSAIGGVLAVSWAPRVATFAVEAEEDAASTAEVGASAATSRALVTADSHDGALHAEFAPYSQLVAIAKRNSPEPPPFAEAPAATGAKKVSSASEASGSRRTASRSTRKVAATTTVLLLVTGLAGVGVAQASPAEAAESALCLPLIMQCGTPTPSPSPSQSSGGNVIGGVVGGIVNGVGGATKGTPLAPSAPAAPLVIGPDTGAPNLTLPAMQLGGSSISFSGLRQVGLVTVHKLDGTTFPVIKLEADDVKITDFVLDVRAATGPSLVSTANTMELHGNVQVWVDSFTASLLGGGALTLGTDQTPTPGNELPAQLLRINLGLVGTTADSITYSNLHQALHE